MSETYYCDWCRREHEGLDPEQVKALYSHVVKLKEFPNGVADVRHIEAAIGRDFPSTGEFHRLVGEWLAKQSGTTLTPGEQLRRKRGFLRLKQRELARKLGVTKAMVCYYESGRSPLSREALEWLNAEKGLSGEKLTKTTSEGDSSDKAIFADSHMGKS